MPLNEQNKIIAMIVIRDQDHLSGILGEEIFALLQPDATVIEIKNAMTSICAGQQHITTRLSRAILTEITESNQRLRLNAFKEMLTRREMEIALLISNGNSTREIAEKLHISRETAATHRKRILKKLGQRNTASLIHYIMNRQRKKL